MKTIAWNALIASVAVATVKLGNNSLTTFVMIMLCALVVISWLFPVLIIAVEIGGGNFVDGVKAEKSRSIPMWMSTVFSTVISFYLAVNNHPYVAALWISTLLPEAIAHAIIQKKLDEKRKP